jgi:hypothetical protein
VFDDLGEDQAGEEEVDGGSREAIDLSLIDEPSPGHQHRNQNDEKDDRDRGHGVTEGNYEFPQHQVFWSRFGLWEERKSMGSPGRD